jgi:serine/threonine protein kinase
MHVTATCLPWLCVLQGIPPAALSKVSSDSLRELITTCIAHDPQQRPSAVQLLKHTFFADLAGEAGICARCCPLSCMQCVLLCFLLPHPSCVEDTLCSAAKLWLVVPSDSSSSHAGSEHLLHCVVAYGWAYDFVRIPDPTAVPACPVYL